MRQIHTGRSRLCSQWFILKRLQMPILQRKTTMTYTYSLIRIVHYQKIKQEIIKIQMNKLVLRMNSAKKRILNMSWLLIKNKNPQKQKIEQSGVYRIHKTISGIQRQKKRECMNLIKSSGVFLDRPSAHQKQKTQFECENTKQMIKTILVCLNRQSQKQKASKQNNKQNKLCEILVDVLQRIKIMKLKQGFTSILCNYLSQFDEDMITQLQTQIEVLQQQSQI